jgi:hypothetical protein
VKLKYFELEDNLQSRKRWYLGGLTDSKGVEFDPQDFTYGKPIKLSPRLKLSLSNKNLTRVVLQPLQTNVKVKGLALDFTFADFDMPIATKEVGELLHSIAGDEIQCVPICVDKLQQEYCIVNVTSSYRCLDSKKSDIVWWSEEDDRPDKIGKARMVTNLHINTRAVANSHIFRPSEWDVVIIVSEVIKSAFENSGVRGVLFTPVS